ncbi:MAG: hypothetical protein KDA52_11800 [Planctomycetaceae bacterium]|nr:hypothetical protein [Planctomycetaceae bacterium]
MRITRTRVCLAGLVCAVGLAFVPLNAAEEGREDEEFYTVVYSIGDLPVWSIDREGIDKISFDPSMLMNLMTRSIDAESWAELGGKGMIGIHAKSEALVIRQTRGTHEKLQDFLSQLRKEHEDRRAETN